MCPRTKIIGLKSQYQYKFKRLNVTINLQPDLMQDFVLPNGAKLKKLDYEWYIKTYHPEYLQEFQNIAKQFHKLMIDYDNTVSKKFADVFNNS